MDAAFGIMLLILLIRRYKLFLNLSNLYLCPCHFRESRHDLMLFYVFQISILWLGIWHFGETVYYYAFNMTDRLLVVHHVLTVILAAWILEMKFFNGYVALPLAGHYVVTVAQVGFVYTMYASMYVAILLWAVFMLWNGHYGWVSKGKIRAGRMLIVLTFMHTCNLLEFGFSTRIECIEVLPQLIGLFVFGVAITLIAVSTQHPPAVFWAERLARRWARQMGDALTARILCHLGLFLNE